MRISQTEIDSVINVYRTRAVAATRGASEADAFSISKDALLMSKVRASYERLPDVREDRVRELRRRIAEGKYYVPTDMIVEKILGRLFSETVPA